MTLCVYERFVECWSQISFQLVVCAWCSFWKAYICGCIHPPPTQTYGSICTLHLYFRIPHLIRTANIIQFTLVEPCAHVPTFPPTLFQNWKHINLSVTAVDNQHKFIPNTTLNTLTIHNNIPNMAAADGQWKIHFQTISPKLPLSNRRLHSSPPCWPLKITWQRSSSGVPKWDMDGILCGKWKKGKQTSNNIYLPHYTYLQVKSRGCSTHRECPWYIHTWI